MAARRPKARPDKQKFLLLFSKRSASFLKSLDPPDRAATAAGQPPFEQQPTPKKQARQGEAAAGALRPGAAIGLVLGRDFSASLAFVKKLIEGSRPRLPHSGWPLVDVWGIADPHGRATGAPKARYRARAAGTRAGGGAQGAEPAAASWLACLSSTFDPVMRGRLFELDKARPVSAGWARRVLGWPPRFNDDATVATAENLLKEDLVQA